MQGYTGSYAINGTKISQPTNGKWLDKETLGLDGNGRPIYPAFVEFEMNWGIISTSDFKLLNDYFNYSNASGTVVVDLPKWGDTDYLFYSYSGTQMSRPIAGEYFSGYITNARLLITSIRV